MIPIPRVCQAPSTRKCPVPMSVLGAPRLTYVYARRRSHTEITQKLPTVVQRPSGCPSVTHSVSHSVSS